MRAQEIMTSPVYGVTADAHIEEAAGLMLQRGFTTLPVITGDGQLLGIVTEAELGGARYTPGTRPDATPEDGVQLGTHATTVRQVMRPAPPPIREHSDVTEIAEVMVETHLRCLPVLGAGGQVTGIVSWRDLLARLLARA